MMDVYWRWYHLVNTFIVYVIASTIVLLLAMSADFREFWFRLAEVDQIDHSQNAVFTILSLFITASGVYITWLIKESQPCFKAIVMARNQLLFLSNFYKKNRVSERISTARKDFSRLPVPIETLVPHGSQFVQLQAQYQEYHWLNRVLSRGIGRIASLLSDAERMAQGEPPHLAQVLLALHQRRFEDAAKLASAEDVNYDDLAIALLRAQFWTILCLHVAGRYRSWHCVALEQIIQCFLDWGVEIDDLDDLGNEGLEELHRRFHVDGAGKYSSP